MDLKSTKPYKLQTLTPRLFRRGRAEKNGAETLHSCLVFTTNGRKDGVRGKLPRKQQFSKRITKQERACNREDNLHTIPKILPTKQFSSHQFAVFNFNYQS